MRDQNRALIDHIVSIREGLKRGDYDDSEAAVSDGVVRRLLEAVGWPRYDQRIVYPQFPIENRKVDFALCDPPGEPQVLLEVKQRGGADDVRAEQQLFGYCYKKEVKIGVLTDGVKWKFYYPHGQGGFVNRLFREINIENDELANISGTFLKYLAFVEVSSGAAIESSRTTYLEFQWQRQFNSVWESLLSVPDPSLINLLTRKVKEKSESPPDRQSVINFLKKQASHMSSEVSVPPSLTDPPSDIKQHSNSPYYTLNGAQTACKTAKDVFVGIFREFAKLDPNFCERYAAKHTGGRKRRELAQRPEDLYSADSELADSNASELPGGWWIDTHMSNPEKDKRIHRACEVVGIEYGRELLVSLSK